MPAGTLQQRAVRFPVKLPVRYKIGGECFWGELVNISSSGALFTTERPLPLGKRVELCINWPARLLDEVPLKLVVKGTIVRVEPGRAAVRMRKHEFRTSGSSFVREATIPGERTNRDAGSLASTGRSSLQVQVANQAVQGVRM
ncbi:MAG TPA: PilZ domain-containing protein [Bryobacteraceae bacterium]|nr:PilZ domain-containing protein [Bryobacteraceae bacterium]